MLLLYFLFHVRWINIPITEAPLHVSQHRYLLLAGTNISGFRQSASHWNMSPLFVQNNNSATLPQPAGAPKASHSKREPKDMSNKLSGSRGKASPPGSTVQVEASSSWWMSLRILFSGKQETQQRAALSNPAGRLKQLFYTVVCLDNVVSFAKKIACA